MTWERQHIREYLARNAWSPPQFLRGVRVAISNNVPAERTLREWLDGGRGMTDQALAAMLAFTDQHPNPGPYGEWQHRVVDRAKACAFDEERILQARRDAVTRERAEARAALLAAERAPRVPASPWFPSRRMLSVSQGTGVRPISRPGNTA